MTGNKIYSHDKKHMLPAVSVLTTSRVARNNGDAARRENHTQQSVTTYSSVR